MPTVTKYATAGSNSGSGVYWSNPQNVGGSIGAACSLGAGEESSWIEATGFDFSIPFGSLVKGIEYGMDTEATVASTIQESSLKPIKGGARQGDGFDFGLIPWLLTTLARLLGNDGDTLSVMWASEDINSSDFGVAVKCDNIGVVEAEASIANLYASVTYDLPKIKKGGIV